jgi:hypothetical protein
MDASGVRCRRLREIGPGAKSPIGLRGGSAVRDSRGSGRPRRVDPAATADCDRPVLFDEVEHRASFGRGSASMDGEIAGVHAQVRPVLPREIARIGTFGSQPCLVAECVRSGRKTWRSAAPAGWRRVPGDHPRLMANFPFLLNKTSPMGLVRGHRRRTSSIPEPGGACLCASSWREARGIPTENPRLASICSIHREMCQARRPMRSRHGWAPRGRRHEADATRPTARSRWHDVDAMRSL